MTDAQLSKPALVRVEHLNKSFPGVRALHDCQFELLAGEVHALMGENGAGKSTLMKILAGIYTPDSGQVCIHGQVVTVQSPRQAQDLGIGIVHQELNLMRHLSAAQNMFIGREPTRLGGLLLDEARLNADAQAVFDRLNLKLDPRTLVSELTVAMQQMVEIAKALSAQSRILILDEPTAALTHSEIVELFRIIAQLTAQGVGVIYISHKMDEIAQIADRVTVLRDGQYIDTVPASTPMDSIIRMMVGRTIDASRQKSPELNQSEVMLDVKQLTRGKAFQNVSFTLRRGEILGFAGLMGAGRTEVARAVFGADRYDSGHIAVKGRSLKITSPAQAVQAGIGYLSEDRKQFGLVLPMQVQANVALAHMAQFLSLGFWLKGERMAQVAHTMVERLRIKTPSIAQTTQFLSGGNQQKVVIAKWLVRDCDILFFDEPTRGIDVGAKSEIYKLLNDLAAQGRAIVVISSELPEILQLAHRVLVMCEGRVTGELSGAQATQENIMHLATQRASRQPFKSLEPLSV